MSEVKGHEKACLKIAQILPGKINTDGQLGEFLGKSLKIISIFGNRFKLNSMGDNYALVTSEGNLRIVKIINIIQIQDEINIKSFISVCHWYKVMENFFDYPCTSNLINTYLVSKLSKEQFQISAQFLIRKCVVLSYKSFLIAKALLHMTDQTYVCDNTNSHGCHPNMISHYFH